MLSKVNRREADRVYSILTRDFGLVRASALGVRKEASKLRGALEPVSLVRISLVRGKEYWRITSVELIEKIDPLPEILRPLALLEKLVQGEAPNQELFDTLIYQSICEGVSEEKFVAGILFHLGYLKEADLKLEKKSLIKAINEGLEQTHLT